VGAAFAWGFIAASSLIVGGVLAISVRIGPRPLGLVMGFGAGVLLSAVAYELMLEASTNADTAAPLAGGLLCGALAFFFGDRVIDNMGGAERKAADGAGGVGLAIVLGIVLDGIPESVVLGLTLVGGEGIGIAFLAAVFLSNLPEAVAATSGLRAGGWSSRSTLVLWFGVAALSGVAAALGYGLLDTASDTTVAFVQAFAGGAILTMLADTMMPEAFEHGGNLVGLFTTLGFFLAYSLSVLV